MSLDQEHYNCLFLRLSGEQKSKYKIGDRIGETNIYVRGIAQLSDIDL